MRMKDKVYVECDCALWVKNGRLMREQAKKLMEATGEGWTGDIMKYCPWCGQILERKED